MELYKYQINYSQGYVDLYFTNRGYSRIFLNEYTGNIYKRRKDQFVLKYIIDHKGLYIGNLQDGTHILIHNHINPGRAEFITMPNFSRGMEVLLDVSKNCTNHPYRMVESALNQIISREPYSATSNSCQTLVNRACTNESKNDDTGKVVLAILGTLFIAAAIDSAFKQNRRRAA